MKLLHEGNFNWGFTCVFLNPFLIARGICMSVLNTERRSDVHLKWMDTDGQFRYWYSCHWSANFQNRSQDLNTQSKQILYLNRDTTYQHNYTLAWTSKRFQNLSSDKPNLTVRWKVLNIFLFECYRNHYFMSIIIFCNQREVLNLSRFKWF